MASLLKNNTTLIEQILNMANSLPEAGDLPALTNEGTAEDLVLGKELIGSDGNKIVGTNPYSKEETEVIVETQADLISQIDAVLENKTVGSENVTEETTAYTSLLNDLKAAVDALPEAGADNGSVETCNVSVFNLGNMTEILYTQYENGAYNAGFIFTNYETDLSFTAVKGSIAFFITGDSLDLTTENVELIWSNDVLAGSGYCYAFRIGGDAYIEG